jgi:hypothetical protein
MAMESRASNHDTISALLREQDNRTEKFFRDLENRNERRFVEQEHTNAAFREKFSILETTAGIIQRELADMKTMTANSFSEFKETITSLMNARKPNWTMIAAISPFALALIGGLITWILTSSSGAIEPVKYDLLQTEANLKALSNQVSSMASIQIERGQMLNGLSLTTKANETLINQIDATVRDLKNQSIASTKADEVSRDDRAKLNVRMSTEEIKLSNEIADRRASEAAMKIRQGENETQFHAVSNQFNLEKAHQCQIDSVMWERTVPGSHLVCNGFYPTTIFQGVGGEPPIP